MPSRHGIGHTTSNPKRRNVSAIVLAVSWQTFPMSLLKKRHTTPSSIQLPVQMGQAEEKLHPVSEQFEETWLSIAQAHFQATQRHLSEKEHSTLFIMLQQQANSTFKRNRDGTQMNPSQMHIERFLRPLPSADCASPSLFDDQ